MDQELSVTLELSRADFNTIRNQIRKVDCEKSPEMAFYQTDCLEQIEKITSLIDEKLESGASTVEQLKSKINTWNDVLTTNINHMKDENQNSYQGKIANKNTTQLRKARTKSISIDNRIQKALTKMQRKR
jgi:hypothetical protein